MNKSSRSGWICVRRQKLNLNNIQQFFINQYSVVDLKLLIVRKKETREPRNKCCILFNSFLLFSPKNKQSYRATLNCPSLFVIHCLTFLSTLLCKKKSFKQPSTVTNTPSPWGKIQDQRNIHFWRNGKENTNESF